MTYSSFGTDDSDLDEWLRQQAESSSLDDLASPDAPMGGGMPAFHAPPHAQMAPLNYNTGPDWTDALGAGTSALAALADLGLNHGRGTGQILSSAGAFGQARAEQRLKGTQDALGYEQKRAELERQNNYNDYLYANMAQRTQHQGTTDAAAAQRIDISRQNAGTKATAESRQGAKVERDTNAQADYAQQFRDYAVERGLAKPGELDNMSYEQMKSANPSLLKAWEYDHAGEKAATETGARIDATNARAGETGAADATKIDATSGAKARAAAAVAEATLPYKTEGAEQGAAARVRGKQQGEQDVGSGMNIPGLIATDPDAAAQSAGDDVTRRKIQDLGGNIKNARDAIAEMVDIRQQYGTELPGNAKTRFDMAKAAVSAAMSGIGATGTLSKDEREYYQSMIPNLSVGWVDALRPGGRDIKLEQLHGALDEFTQLGNGKLRAYGWGIDTGAQAPQPSAAPAGRPRRFANPADSMDGLIPPEANADPSGPSTRPGAPAPRFPGSAPASAGPSSSPDTVMMRSTNGIVGPVPRDKVQTAISKGWKLVQ